MYGLKPKKKYSLYTADTDSDRPHRVSGRRGTSAVTHWHTAHTPLTHTHTHGRRTDWRTQCNVTRRNDTAWIFLIHRGHWHWPCGRAAAWHRRRAAAAHIHRHTHTDTTHTHTHTHTRHYTHTHTLWHRHYTNTQTHTPLWHTHTMTHYDTHWHGTHWHSDQASDSAPPTVSW